MPKLPESPETSRGAPLRAALLLLLLMPAAARAEDLLQVYAQARASDPVLAAAEASTGVAREGVAQARAPLLPQWSLGWTYQQTRRVGERTRELASNVSQVLLDLNRMATLRSAQARAQGQEAVLEAARQALCVRVTQAYVGVLSAADSLATVKANEDAFARQVQQAQARFGAGLGAALDIDQARTYHALARANTVAAGKSLALAREALAEITGAPPGTLQALGEDLPAGPPAPAQADSWVDVALRDNPALRAERLAVEASERDLDAARAAHLPTVSLGLESGRSSSWLPGANGVGSSAGRFENTVGISLTVPLFAGGTTESQRRQAVYQRESARATLEQRRRAVLRETQEQLAAVQAALDQIAITRGAVAAADRALAATQTGQELGTRSMTDLLLAIQNQASAQNAYSQARHQYLLSRVLLLQAAGGADETQLAALNALLRKP